MISSDMDFRQTDSSEQSAGMARVLSLLGTDSRRNIDILINHTRQILKGVCAIYHRLDEKNKSLVVWPDHHESVHFGLGWHAHDPAHGEAAFGGKIKCIAIPDLKAHPVFCTDPFVCEHHFRSYLGYPLCFRQRVAGSLGIMDIRQREFTREDLDCIKTLAMALSREEERLFLERELFEEREKCRILTENTHDALCIIQDGFFKYANSRTLELIGYSWNTLQKTPLRDLIHPDDLDSVLSIHDQELKGGKKISTLDFRVLNKKKKSLKIRINSVQILYEGSPAILGCARDLSRVNELEERLERAKKMELIGTMAGGVAHDLNNILSGLVSYPELLLFQLPPDSPLKEPIAFMHDSGLKAAEIVQDLLTLTRRGIAVKNSISLNHVIHEYFISAAHRRLEKNYPHIRFKVYLEDDLLNLMASASHISKVIMNLVINAAEAIKDQGTVTVESFNRYLDIPLSGYDRILEGEYVVLRVTDNGAGIPKKDIGKIFEPFYTKKQMGRSGSGLGLSVVWNCVKDHSGYIEITSKINKGTTFEIYFPATRKETGQKPESLLIDDFRGNKESILVIDDVHEQRRIARDSLKMLGYTPFTVPSGEKAVVFLEKRPVDLIILDMKMAPGMDGLNAYREILKIRPDQKAIIASGYSEDNRVKEALKIGVGQYIKKPYTLKKLAHAIKKELENNKNLVERD